MASIARLSDDQILAHRERFSRARALFDAGQAEEARGVWWWPKSESFPARHWTENPVAECVCKWSSAIGMLGLCFDCGGATAETSSLIPRRAG